MRTISLLAVTVMMVLAVAGRAAAYDGACPSAVMTTEGAVSGTTETGSQACAWKGIPYAAPPVGDLRWRAPQRPAHRDQTLVADEVGFACPQSESITSGGEAKGFEEDCLTLNVWAPPRPGTYPVMVFIHGGGFMQGSGTYEMFNGGRLAAERNVVLVTINYRLGNLGFLALPELDAEDPANGSGNYGFLDQIAALQWVHDNIAGFGGDPGDVMVFGQSAGGMSVVYLLVSPRAAGLFQRAGIMSGPYDLILPKAEGFAYGEGLALQMGCADAADKPACLRALPTSDFVADSQNMMFAGGPSLMPRISGDIIPGPPIELIRAGNFNRVPVMVGSTRDELRLYTLTISGLGLLSKGAVNTLMRWVAGDNAPEIMALYDYAEFRRPVDLMVRALSDAAITSKAFGMAEALADAGQPVYYYRFDWDDTRFPHKMGAFHGLDEPLVFGALNIDSNLAKLLANKKAIESGMPLSEKMMSYYSNFARSGDPNGEGLPEWPPYNTATRPRIYFDNPITVDPLSERDLARYQYLDSRSLADLFGKGLSKLNPDKE